MKKYVKRVAIVLVLLIVVTGVAVEIQHWRAFGHLVPPTLHADVTIFPWDISIPGITKRYEAHISNYGLLPRKIERCEFLTDAFAPGSSIGYRLEHWSKQANRWEQMLDVSSVYCQPVPLSMVQADRRKKWLWPGQSLSTGEEATGARGHLKGESLRFIIVANGRVYPTSAFVIDEQLQDNGTAYRLAH